MTRLALRRLCLCAVVRGPADIRRSDVIYAHGHRHGDPIDGEIGIGQLRAGLGELADLVDIGRAEPDIGRETRRAVVERRLHSIDECVVLGQRHPDRLRDGADIVAGPRPQARVAAFHIRRDRIEHPLDRLKRLPIRHEGCDRPCWQRHAIAP